MNEDMHHADGTPDPSDGDCVGSLKPGRRVGQHIIVCDVCGYHFARQRVLPTH